MECFGRAIMHQQGLLMQKNGGDVNGFGMRVTEFEANSRKSGKNMTTIITLLPASNRHTILIAFAA